MPVAQRVFCVCSCMEKKREVLRTTFSPDGSHGQQAPRAADSDWHESRDVGLAETLLRRWGSEAECACCASTGARHFRDAAE